jgi:flagellar assembly factor FliW
MLIKTRCFGEVDIDEKKIVHFDNGLLGFEDYKDFTLIFDSDQGRKSIMWLQSVQEQSLALPVVDPLLITQTYSPIVEDELLANIGGGKDEDLFLMVTLTIPADLTKMTANYKAPLIINTETLKGIQIVAENEDYLVKFPIYDILKNRKGGE